MIKNSISFFINLGLLMPLMVMAENIPVHNKIQKEANIIRDGAIAAGGAILLLLAGTVIMKQLGFAGFSDGDQKNKKWYSPLSSKKNNEHRFEKYSLIAGTFFGAGMGSGMLWYSVPRLKEALYGQTNLEKEVHQEHEEKIKETIKEAGKTIFDISKCTARLTGYSISTIMGLVMLLASTWHWTLGIIRHKKAKMKYLIDEWHNHPKKIISNTIQIPLGMGALLFGIHGLSKEYASWRKSSTRQHIIDATDILKEKVGFVVDNVIVDKKETLFENSLELSSNTNKITEKVKQ